MCVTGHHANHLGLCANTFHTCIHGALLPQSMDRGCVQHSNAQSMAAPASSSWRLVDSTGSELHVDDGMVLGRQRLGPGFDFVSRNQAVLNIDGAQLFLTSHGQNPTGLLPAGSTEWHWLRPQDDRVPVTPGSVIVLDKKRRDTARFTLLSTPSLGEDAGSDTRGGTSSGHGGSAVPIELSSSDDDDVQPPADVAAVEADAADEAKWSCSVCTFSNAEADASCMICEAPRAGAKRPRMEASLRDRVGGDMRIRWDAVEPLDLWIRATLPSKVPNDVAAWIQVENTTAGSPGFTEQRATPALDHAPYLKELAKVEALIARTNRVPAEVKRACVQSIQALAQEQRYTTGKWMIFLTPDEADAAWEAIARATAQGELGCSAKISPTADLPLTERTVCCVYVPDFADRAEVQRVLRALQRLGMDVTSGFKPDVYTELNIMRDNQWRLEPTMYKVKEALEWPDGIARAAYSKVRATPWG